jgi:hypothetical protein
MHITPNYQQNAHSIRKFAYTTHSCFTRALLTTMGSKKATLLDGCMTICPNLNWQIKSRPVFYLPAHMRNLSYIYQVRGLEQFCKMKINRKGI